MQQIFALVAVSLSGIAGRTVAPPTPIFLYSKQSASDLHDFPPTSLTVGLVVAVAKGVMAAPIVNIKILMIKNNKFDLLIYNIIQT